MKKIHMYESYKEGGLLQKLPPVAFQPEGEKVTEMELLLVYPTIEEQLIQGFGGAFTPAAAETYSALPSGAKNKVMELLFGKEGLQYNCGRVSIGSCDFSKGNYSYCEEQNEELASFSICEDENIVLPFLQEAQRHQPNMVWMGSPWSPPSWMKTNGEMCHGGELLPQYKQVYAGYLVKFLQAYAAAGIPVEYITVQNEPQAVQRWESCLYSGIQERDFILKNLAPAIKEAGLSTKIVVWDHNKERVFTRAREIFLVPEARQAVAGIAFHWYSGDHFENLALCRRFFPEMELFFTEGCVEVTQSACTSMAAKAAGSGSSVTQAPWEFGECYGHDIMGNLNNGMAWYMDWNVLLNQQGGPNHVGNYCSAPLICNTISGEIFLQPSYYYIAHFSRFIPRGSRRIACSRFTDKLEMFASVAPNGTTTVVLLNLHKKEVKAVLKDEQSGLVAPIKVKPHSILTLQY